MIGYVRDEDNSSTGMRLKHSRKFAYRSFNNPGTGLDVISGDEQPTRCFAWIVGESRLFRSSTLDSIRSVPHSC